MIDLRKVVHKTRDDLKREYLKDQAAAWSRPLIVLITSDDVKFMADFPSEKKVIDWLREFSAQDGIKGIVIGRMVAKYSQTIKDHKGDPQILERAILVSGRMFTTNQTYVTITKSIEHRDLRMPKHDEPVKDRPVISGLESPDKIQPIVNLATGHLQGFKEMQFAPDRIFDSEKGQRCILDPIIAGVVKGAEPEKYA